MNGLFITFEGIDGAGKSTHIDALADWLTAQGRAVVRTREPGGTPLAETLRALVLAEPMDALTEALLVFAARRDHIGRVIAPALVRGQVVISDRFTDATFAYQGGGRRFDWRSLQILERMAQYLRPDSANLAFGEDGSDDAGASGGGPALRSPALLQPDLTLWFDLPPEVAAARLAGARAPDKFERQPVEFFRAVAAGYARRAAEAPRRFARIDAGQPREAVALAVMAAVQAHLGQPPALTDPFDPLPAASAEPAR